MVSILKLSLKLSWIPFQENNSFSFFPLQKDFKTPAFLQGPQDEWNKKKKIKCKKNLKVYKGT